MTHIPPVKIVKASAGSGKTFSLTAHYISLLFREHINFSQILAITFTNKATAEMKTRILSVLEGLARNNGEHLAYQKIILEQNPQLSPNELSFRAQQIYRQILHRYGMFAVTTIDGFVQKIIRSFSYELEIGASYRLEMNIDKVKKSLAARLNQVLNNRPDLLQWIIRYAREQIELGKHWNYTHTLMELANEIFKERYQFFHNAIKGLKTEDRLTTFETIDQINTEGIRSFEQTLSTLLLEAKDIFNRYAVEITDFQGKSRNPVPKLPELNKSSNFIAFYEKIVPYIDNPDKWQSKGLSLNMQALYNALNPLLGKTQQFYQENAAEYYLALALKENIYYLHLLQEMSGLLRDYRDEHNVMLINESQNLLREINKSGLENTSFIWEKVGTHFKHFLFDEFQDTSSTQWSNFVPLMLNMLAERSPNTPLADHLIVGDIKQSIYRWRSGDWTLLDKQVALDLGSSLIHEQNLQENYRSLDSIIDFNNFLYDYGPRWLQDQLNDKVKKGVGEEIYRNWWEEEGLHHRIINAYNTSFQYKPKKDKNNTGGQVHIEVLPLEKGNKSSRVNQTKDLALQKMGNTILSWLQSGKYLPGQIGVLVRTNKEAQEVIEYLLSIQQPLPPSSRFNVVSGEALLLANNRGIKLIINCLKAMVTNPKDAAIFKANCLYLFHQKEDEPFSTDNSLWFNLNDSTDINHWGSTLPDAVKKHWDNIQLRPLSELIEFLIKAFQLDSSESDIPFLLAFKDLVENFTKLGEHGLLTFLNYWEEDGIRKALPAGEGASAVEILTIHKSKGLAFDVVMIPFCSWNLDSSHLRDFWVSTTNTRYEILQSVPVKYNANKIGKSSLFRAYYEEMLFNYLDALNMLYVATTRTIRELYISIPDETTSTTLIADLLLNVLKQYGHELHITYKDSISFPEETPSFTPKTSGTIAKTIKESLKFWQSENDWYWSLNQYPISEHLNKALDSKKIRADLLLLGEQDNHIRLGLILHEILSKAERQAEIETLLIKMQTEGLIKREEIPLLKKQASLIFENTALRKLLEKNYPSLNEQSIIDITGNVFRPDKVLIGPAETVLLDFKFTGKKNNQIVHKEHIKQVQTYTQLLQEMGYPNVRGYLFYAFFNTLVSVQ
ncbi:UvrD-helicase domain-containing protein [Olivibacter sp. SDN3]|uniref:UvrD-helicase domain-containing protein n=1 Tax=Olivibacter sp. SDN3 TaxID=2764720 RepID=UPI0016518137|nr:UvrD-helicase domain-containing protein [Olivibacter sp. SDN3]QNL51127.1 UvrD-helicase domain-containing protein [Olivibacter sp. SDN3]